MSNMTGPFKHDGPTQGQVADQWVEVMLDYLQALWTSYSVPVGGTNEIFLESLKILIFFWVKVNKLFIIEAWFAQYLWFTWLVCNCSTR